jgi:hypothetical protein
MGTIVRADGSPHEVTVTISDRGTGDDVHPDERFECAVVADDGKGSRGNPGRSAALALGLVHWQNLG